MMLLYFHDEIEIELSFQQSDVDDLIVAKTPLQEAVNVSITLLDFGKFRIFKPNRTR